MAHLIVKHLWIDQEKLSISNLEIMEKQAKVIKLSADLGRILNKILIGEDFSRFTADQWKTFILVYVIPITWDLLSVTDHEILGNFVRVCSLLVYQIIDNKALNEAHD